MKKVVVVTNGLKVQNLKVSETPFGPGLRIKARYSFLDKVKQINHNKDSEILSLYGII